MRFILFTTFFVSFLAYGKTNISCVNINSASLKILTNSAIQSKSSPEGKKYKNKIFSSLGPSVAPTISQCYQKYKTLDFPQRIDFFITYKKKVFSEIKTSFKSKKLCDCIIKSFDSNLYTPAPKDNFVIHLGLTIDPEKK